MSFGDVMIITVAVEEITIFLTQNIPTKSSMTIKRTFVSAKEAYKM